MMRPLALAASVVCAGLAAWTLFAIGTALVRGEGHGPIFWSAIGLLVVVTCGLLFLAVRLWRAWREP